MEGEGRERKEREVRRVGGLVRGFECASDEEGERECLSSEMESRSCKLSRLKAVKYICK
jgi:hypothetical protein